MYRLEEVSQLPPSSKGRQTTFSVEIPEDLATDLAAFLQAHYDAVRNTVVRKALRVFIDEALRAEPAMRGRFLKARDELLGTPRLPGRVVEFNPERE